jgi:hypothetical protein
MTRTIAPAVPQPRRSPETAALQSAAVHPAAPEREGTLRTARPAAEYWDVSEARWRAAR